MKGSSISVRKQISENGVFSIVEIFYGFVGFD